MKSISYLNVDITGGFWKKKLDMVSDVTVDSVYNRFVETHRFSALDCLWREGEPNEPHVFWDSDIAKWAEGATYSLKNKYDEKIEAIIDDMAERMLRNRDENGYYNSHFLVKGDKLTKRDEHELYCLGHFIEAAIAYYEATGKRNLLGLVCDYTDYVEKRFVIEKSVPFATPGHPEIELALVKLYEVTGEERYLKLSKHFIDAHGNNDKDESPYHWNTPLYNQDDVPLRERNTADGHCVRSLYLLSAVADIAYIYGDKELGAAAERCFENIVNRRMYITGATGSTCHGEAFTIDYDLPNRTAYAETCASIALAFFAQRMIRLSNNTKYADTVERVMYNGILSGISMDGKSFFYENPLEIDLDFNNVSVSSTGGERMPITQRLEVFDCSCCPPNVIRFIASVGEYAYTHTEDTLYVHQFIDSVMKVDGMTITQRTEYPVNGKVCFSVENCSKKYIRVRIPGWCDSFSLKYDGNAVNDDGYIVLEAMGDSFCFEIDFDMKVRFVSSNKCVHQNAGRVAVMRGPVVYCLEGVDNGRDIQSISLDIRDDFHEGDCEFLVPSIVGKGYTVSYTDDLYFDADDIQMEERDVKLIPYYAFANRGDSSMLVWIMRK